MKISTGKILLTNWINLAGVSVAIWLFGIILTWGAEPLDWNIFNLALVIFISVCLYGFPFWMFCFLAIIFLDLFLIGRNRSRLILKLMIEWMIISLPFGYWFIIYTEWTFLVGIIAFLVTQLLRAVKIRKLEERS